MFLKDSVISLFTESFPSFKLRASFIKIKSKLTKEPSTNFDIMVRISKAINGTYVILIRKYATIILTTIYAKCGEQFKRFDTYRYIFLLMSRMKLLKFILVSSQ